MEKVKRPDWVSGVRCLKDEQIKQGPRKFWWKDWFCPKGRCTCPNLIDTQIDILAIFERTDGRRLGLHIECKRPGDTFEDSKQASRYPERLKCWTQPGKGPRKSLPHQEAVAILICDRNHGHSTEDIRQFDGVIYFDEISMRIPIYPAPETATG